MYNILQRKSLKVMKIVYPKTDTHTSYSSFQQNRVNQVITAILAKQ